MGGSSILDVIVEYAQTVLELLILGAKLPLPPEFGADLTFDWVNGVAMAYGLVLAGITMVVLVAVNLGLVVADEATAHTLATPFVYETMQALAVIGTAAVGGVACERADREIRTSEFWEWGRNPL